jgi:hypothetical protein
LLAVAACGIKGPPVPPERPPPVPVADLRAVVDGDRIHLTWSTAKPSVEGKSAIVGFYIFRWRSAMDKPACPGCPKVFERIAEIDVESGKADADGRIRFAHDGALETGYRYTFKVMGYSKDGRMSADSNLLEFDY